MNEWMEQFQTQTTEEIAETIEPDELPPVVGVPSDLGDEEIKLFVRLTDNAALSAADLHAWCAPRMPHFQVPRFIEFIDEFPKTPTQRIRKNDLSKTVNGAWDAETTRS